MTKKYTYPLSLTIACITLLVVSGLFINTYISMKSRGDFRGRHSQRPPLRVDNLQGWMTFDYLNHGFGIPNEYLKDELHITSNTYPKITLRKAASLLGATTTDFINITSRAISIYLQNSSSTKK